MAVSAEVPVWKGRRFGNLVVVGRSDLPVQALERRLRAGAFPYRLLAGRELTRWLGGAAPFTDDGRRGLTVPRLEPWLVLLSMRYGLLPWQRARSSSNRSRPWPWCADGSPWPRARRPTTTSTCAGSPWTASRPRWSDG